MKQFSVWCAALLTTAVLFIGGGCAELTDEVAAATSDRWYEYTAEKTIATGDSQLGNAYLYLYYDTKSDDTGLRVRLAQTGAKVYADHTYSSIGSGRWTALVASGKLTKCSTTPNVSGYTEISTDFSWESFLTQIIVDKLLGE